MCDNYLNIEQEPCDYNYIRHPGWREENACIKSFFSSDTVKLISNKITELTRGVDKKNRKIIVPNERICEVMDGVFRGFRNPTGDIYSRYIIPTDEQQNLVQYLIDQTIEVIYNHIVNEMGIEEANSKLSAWVQVYGNFNPHGIRAYPILKTLEKRPLTMQFNMNY